MIEEIIMIEDKEEIKLVANISEKIDFDLTKLLFEW